MERWYEAPDSFGQWSSERNGRRKMRGQFVKWDQAKLQLVVRRIEDVNKWLIEALRGSTRCR
ncbi:hypothetical protein [Sinorhizobium saheli]|uniref:hypothetical protein n=1 Tax=Sinorhizobium saheli TaxID=36856 RepID=UPI001296CC76|nr:hypothetical protein [Sinorhizobium saheli]MQW88654.1 hypothetical protein [Sinorhizobium saheli]